MDLHLLGMTTDGWTQSAFELVITQDLSITAWGAGSDRQSRTTQWGLSASSTPLDWARPPVPHGPTAKPTPFDWARPPVPHRPIGPAVSRAAARSLGLSVQLVVALQVSPQVRGGGRRRVAVVLQTQVAADRLRV